MHRSPAIHSLRRRWLIACLSGLAIAVGCARGARPPEPARPTNPAPPAPPARNATALSFDATPLYRQMGLIARGFPLAVLGRAAYLASSNPDTTHVVVALAFASTSFTFAREADNRFRAAYDVSLLVGRGTEVVARADAEEEVLVGSFRETTRSDEAIIFQEILDVPPGRYTLAVTVRDQRSNRSIDERITIDVPRLGDGSLSSPTPIAEVAPRSGRGALPNVLLNASGMAVVGRDTVIPLYLEAYGGASAPVRLLVRNERGRTLWTDTVTMTQRDGMASAVVGVPVAKIGIGLARLTFVHEGSLDSSSAFVFAGFGGELPVATYDDMLSYLRYYANSARLQKLRDAPEEERPAAWAQFVRETDSDPQTSMHEELRAYFARLVRANTRFREEATPGWLSDRGRVYIALGEPDHIIEPAIGDYQRNRQELWEYRSLNLQLSFYDQTGAGRWRLTQSSAVRFETEFRRRLR